MSEDWVVSPLSELCEVFTDGDWVESVTALVEYHDGRMEIINWASMIAPKKLTSTLSEQAGAK